MTKKQMSAAVSTLIKKTITVTYVERGRLDQATCQHLAVVFNLTTFEIKRKFQNCRHYWESRIRKMLIDEKVISRSSPKIEKISSQLSATTSRVLECLDKYYEKIKAAIESSQ